jgi:1-acyl-sn-glycerol-3-phosphate acyltransferase
MRPEVVLAGALGLSFHLVVRQGLRGVWVRGVLPPGPVVLAVNHHSWWDAFVILRVLRQQRRSGVLLMAAGNLSRFAFLRTIGVFSHRELRTALAAVRRGHVLVIFPEGELRTAGPAGPLAAGASWFARQAPATLVVAAVRVTLRAHAAPEAFVSLVRCPGDQADLAAAFDSALRELDAQLAQGDPALPPPEFRRIVRGRRDWDERLQALAGLTRR